jgi:16S rRNA (adenine1518-N6/adenine1519-N6)-dimethyltransferase
LPSPPHPRDILRERGLAASKERGQSFLTQPATARAIVESAGVRPGELVVEIGPGLGALTLPLAERAGRVRAVELDRGVCRALEEIVAAAGADNVELVHGDALGLDWPALAARAGGPVLVVGNLPYSVSSPLLFRLLAAPAAWRRATLMLQEEVAVRLAAGPGSRDYGRLSVLVQAWCSLAVGLAVGPGQFFPRPKVASRVVHLEPLARPLAPEAAEDPAWFARVVKAAFSQRRKTLANSLAAGLGRERAGVAAALEAAGVDPRARAESLAIPELGRAAGALGVAGAGGDD